MVGAGRVVTERNCRIGAHENRAGVFDLPRTLGSVLGDDEQVLGRELVGDPHRLIEVADDDRAAGRRANDVRALQAQQQVFQLLVHAIRPALPSR